MGGDSVSVSAEAEVFGMASFETSVAQRMSSAVKSAKPLDSQDAEGWVDYWTDRGL